jgi:hypothetical protein
MKKIYTIFLLLIFFFLRNTNISAQWTASEGMDEASCYSMVIMDSTMFACVDENGIYSRNITGGQWQQKFPSQYFGNIIKAGDVLFAKAFNHNFRSMDHGDNWENTDSIFGIHSGYYNLVAIDSTIFFLGSSLLRSDDYGETSYIVLNYHCGPGYSSLFANNHTLFYVGHDCNELYYSNNKGVDWDSVSKNGLPQTFNPKEIYNYNNDFWTSSGWGWPGDPPIYKWNHLTQAWEASDSIGVIHFNTYNGLLHAGGAYGFYRYDSVINHWIQINPGVEPIFVRDFCSLDTNLFLCGESGIYKSGPGYNWQRFDDGLHQASIVNLATHENEVWVITNYGFYKSTDAGTHFLKMNPPYPEDPKKIVINSSYYTMISGDGFSLSGDYGSSWVNYNSGLPNDFVPNNLVVNSQNRFITSFYSIYRSEVFPVNWQSILIDSTLWINDIYCDDSVVLVAVQKYFNGSEHKYMLRSTDQGLTFDSTGFQCDRLYSSNNSLFSSCIVPYQSMDEGLSWNIIPIPDTIYSYGTMGILQNENSLAVSGAWSYAAMEQFIYLSFDNGNSWTDIKTNLPHPAFGWIGPLESINNRILASVYENGLWYNDYVLTESKDIIPNKNQTLKISPNPASGKITVTLTAEKYGTGNIRIIDLTGRTVFDCGIKEFEKGKNQILIDVQNFIPGVYIISFTADGKLVHGKFVKR